MESILSHANQIFITMPAKAAGASMKAFVSNCVSSSHFGTSGGDGTIGGNTLAGGNSSWASEHDNFVDEGLEEMFLTSSFQLPRIVASHIKSDTVLINLMRHMTRGSLLIYLYRHETDRLMSSLRWIAERRLCKRFWKGIDSNFTVFMEEKSNKCVISERDLIQKIIKPRKAEITYSTFDIMTCDFYEALKDNKPNILFVHYKQANPLQELIAKQFCPEQRSVYDHKKENYLFKSHVLLDTISSSSNVGHPTTTEVTLEDWLVAKKNILEWSLHLRSQSSCQSKTKNLEEKLLACSDEIMRFNV